MNQDPVGEVVIDSCPDHESKFYAFGTLKEGTLLYAFPPEIKKPSVDDLWKSKEIMELNAELGLTMDQIKKFSDSIINLLNKKE